MNPMNSREEGARDQMEIARRIVDESHLLNSMNPKIIYEICTGFKLVTGDPNENMKRVKEQLATIVVREREDWMDYLRLARFNRMNVQARKQAGNILEEAWIQFQKRCQEESQQPYQKYLCKSKQIKEIESFHLRNFYYIKNALFFQDAQFFRMMSGYPPAMITSQNNENYNLYAPHMGMQGMQGMQPQYMQIPMNYEEKVKMEDMININRDSFPEAIAKEQYFQPKKQGKKQVNYPHEQIHTSKSRNEKDTNQASNKAFWTCACRGKVSAQQRHFECEECHKKFHLACLLIPIHATEKPKVTKKCPQCSLKNNNAFYSVIGEPLETFWSDDKQLHKQKITIKGKKCRQIIEKGYSIQLKFMKVEGKNLFQWDELFAMKSAVKEEGEGNPRVKKAALNEILIKNQLLKKGNGEDVKISLDCMKNGRVEEGGNLKKTIMLFVAIYIVQKKLVDEVVNATYEDCEQNYLDKYVVGNEKIGIEVIDSSGKLIEMPVRGADCDHPDVFDLEDFIKHCYDFNNQSCFICQIKCRSFKVDRQIHEQIKKIREAYPNENSEYPKLEYKDGEFSWSVKEQKKGKSNEDIDEDDEDLKSEMSEMLDDSLDLSSLSIPMDEKNDEDCSPDSSKLGRKTKKQQKNQQ